MINFSTSTGLDTPQLADWIVADPYHRKHVSPEWWLTGAEGSYIALRLDDEQGPVLYLRVDDDGDYYRLHVQFAPSEIVSRFRVMNAITSALPHFKEHARLEGKQGLITESISPSLIRFLQLQGFESVGNNDYMQPVVREIAEESEDAVKVK